MKSPHMYVRNHRGPDGALRLRAAHLPTVHEVTPEESAFSTFKSSPASWHVRARNSFIALCRS
ncbi:hypothetical protein LT966_32830 [Streptomyces griseobrunneus]